MLKAKKVLIALFLAVVMIFSVAGCNVGTQNELQKTIDDLQSRIEELNDQIAEMEDQLRERDEKIEQLEDELIKNLPEESWGTFYTLQEAYGNGWLTQADLMSIAYYHNGGRIYNEEIMSEDYEPAPKTPEVLNKETEFKIKSVAAKNYRKKYNKNAEADGFRITEYCGTYNGCVPVMMSDVYFGGPAVERVIPIAGINIFYGNGNDIIQVWRFENEISTE